jgi:DNA-binding NarL/FixJ family response regulator
VASDDPRIPEAGRERFSGGSTAASRPSFSNSQTEILHLLVEGLSNGEIAAHVHLSENTVKTHVRAILRRAGARNRVEVAVRAVREGWVS